MSRVALLFALHLVAVPLFSQVPEDPFPLEIWLQDGAPIPGTDARALAGPPAMGPGDAAFTAPNRSLTGFGVYLAERDGIVDLVGDRFWLGVSGLSYDGDWLSFTAFEESPDCEDCQHLYRYADGALTRIFSAGDPVPGDPDQSPVAGLGGTSTEAGEIVFVGARLQGTIPNPQILLRYTEADGVEVLVDEETAIPGEDSATFTVVSDPRVSGGTVFFRGFYPGGEGIFALRDGELRRIAAVGDPVPGGTPGEVFTGFSQETRLSADGGAVAFLGTGSVGSEAVYWTVGGQVERAVGSDRSVPGGGGAVFSDLGQVALSGSALAFEAAGVLALGGRDVYLLRDGVVIRLAEGGCSGHLLTSESFRDARVGFVRSDEQPASLRVAHLEIPPPVGETYASEDHPDFLFTVRISADGSPIATQVEPECLADALCISGALPGRAELSLRILGPRPNGRLWPVIGRMSPSRIEVWIEQLSTGLVRYYLLDDLPRTQSELPGVVDRRGFPAS